MVNEEIEKYKGLLLGKDDNEKVEYFLHSIRSVFNLGYGISLEDVDKGTKLFKWITELGGELEQKVKKARDQFNRIIKRDVRIKTKLIL